MSLHHELITPDLRTTSRIVAEKFGKQHKNVLRAIEITLPDLPEGFSRLNFEPATYLDAQGKPRVQYEMTRDGFTLITMGFTGKAAMEWKIRFIEAFNLMEDELRRQTQVPEADGGADMSWRDWLALVREARLLGGASAGHRAWALSPLPKVLAARRPGGADPAEGRACLAHVLDRFANTIALARSGEDEPCADLSAAGLRARDDGLFIANRTLSLFDGTRWAGGAHPGALATLPGVFAPPHALTLAGNTGRGLILPWALVADVQAFGTRIERGVA